MAHTSTHTMAHGNGHNNICNTLEMLYAFANDSLHTYVFGQSVMNAFDAAMQKATSRRGEKKKEERQHSTEKSATVAHSHTRR